MAQMTNRVQDMSTTQLIKFVRDIFEKDPPIQLSKLTVDELTVLELLTVDSRASFTTSTQLLSIGRPGAPAFLNSWVNFDGGFQTAGFWKDAFGIIHLQGRIKNGSALNTVAFNLPPGYRPNAAERFITESNGSTGVLEVQQDGDVVPVSGSTTSFSLSGVTFRAA